MNTTQPLTDDETTRAYNDIAEFFWSKGEAKYELAARFIADNPDFGDFWHLYMMMAIMRDINEGPSKPDGSIYFLRDDNSGNVKIGFTKGSAVTRTNQIKGMNHTPLTLLFHIHADKKCESELHRLFKPARIHHEWFNGSAVSAFIPHLEPLQQEGKVLTSEMVESFADSIGKTLIPSAQLQIENREG